MSLSAAVLIGPRPPRPTSVTLVGTVPSFGEYRNSAYGNGVTVLVSREGPNYNSIVVTKSTDDGVTWSAPTEITTSNVDPKIKFLNNAFFIFYPTSIQNSVLRSTDGVTWFLVTMPIAARWEMCVYGAGKYLFLANGTATATSTDGVTWTAGTNKINSAHNNAVYGAGLFVVPCSFPTNGTYLTSPDGVTWTTRTSTGMQSVYKIEFDGSGFLASVSASTYTTTLYSTTGTSWTFNSSLSQPFRMGACGAFSVGGGRWITMSTTSFCYESTNNGVSWTLISPQLTPYGVTGYTATPYSDTLLWTGTYLLTTEYYGFNTKRSTDGITWTSGGEIRGLMADNASILFANGKFIALPYELYLGYYHTSIDGITWERQQFPVFFNGGFAGLLIWTGTYYAYTHPNINNLYTSPDLITWTEKSPPVRGDVVTYLNNLLILIGNKTPIASPTGKHISYSSDGGNTWSTPVLVTSDFSGYITYGNGMYMLMQYTGAYSTSTDLVTWTSRTIPVTESTIQTINWSGSQFFALGAKNAYSSTDGITWTTTALPSPANVSNSAATKVITINGRYYAPTYNALYSSANGQAWVNELVPPVAPWANFYSEMDSGNGIVVLIAGTNVYKVNLYQY